VVKGVIDNDLSLQDALSRKYGNYTAIARLIKPKVEKDLGRKVNFESLVTSVKRIKPRFQISPGGIESVLAQSVVNVRTDVAKLNLEKSKRSLEAARNIMATYQEEFLQVSESNSAITMVFDQKLLEEIHKKFHDEDVLDEQSDLAAIIVHSPTEIVRTPGVVLSIYMKIAENHVNIEDTVSCFTDTIVVIRMDDVARTFSTLTDLISEARAKSKKRQRGLIAK
jgi:aspartokinase